jgi:hypothetical protein
LFEPEELDFLVVFSSIASLHGGVGQVDYCAANAFLDAWVNGRSRRDRRVQVINWDAWQSVGMAHRVSSRGMAAFKTNTARSGISPDEGVRALENVLQMSVSQLVISPVRLDEQQHKAHHEPQSVLQTQEHNRPIGGNDHVAPRTALEERVLAVFEACLGYSGLGVHDDLFDLGGDSLIAARVRNELQRDYAQLIHLAAIYEASTPAKLARYLADHYKGHDESIHAEREDDAAPGIIRSPTVELLRGYHSRLTSGATPRPDRKAGRAVFILCAPRTGSTLLRVMLGRHHRLFSPPEMGLLLYEDFATRNEALSAASGSRRPSNRPGRSTAGFWNEGLIQAIAQARGCNIADASACLEKLVHSGTSTHQFVLQLQEWLKDQVLVDKTPGYALHPTILQRMELSFQDAHYIHLVRHPCGMIPSYADARLDLLFDEQLRQSLPSSREEIAEAVWLISNENITAFLAQIPAERQLRIRYEDLVSAPQKTLSALCRALGIEFEQALLNPYGDANAGMAEGLHAESRMIGDHKFHLYTQIESPKATEWRRFCGNLSLSDSTIRLAHSLGYPDTVASGHVSGTI